MKPTNSRNLAPSQRPEAFPHSLIPAVRTREAANLLGYSCAALKKWRATCVGPPFIRIGRSVRYRIDDLLDWQQRHVVPCERNLLKSKDGREQHDDAS